MAFKEPSAADRQKAAQEARKAALEKFKNRPGPGDPAFMAREEERRAVLAARAERQAAREAAAREKAAREEEERRIALIRLREELDRKDRERAEEDERQRALEIEKKAERDARYARRKARQKK